MEKFAFIYARVSTEEQAKKLTSVQAQFNIIREYARKENITILKEFADEGISAYQDTVRPQFNKMIEEAKKTPNLSFVLVHEQSRFYRRRAESATVKAELLKYGVKVICTDSPPGSDPVGNMWLESIHETRSQAESMQTSIHTMKGMKQNAITRDSGSDWYYKNGGSPPYGYKNKKIVLGKDSQGKDIVKSIWLEDPKTSPILKQIFKWRAENELSYNQIRDKLNEQGVSAPRKKFWTDSSVGAVLRNIAYTGVYVWNKINFRGNKKEKPKEEWIIVEKAHPSLISKNTFEKVKALAKKRNPIQTNKRAPGNSRWVLNYNFKCKNCGGNMVGGVKFNMKDAYLCGNYQRRGKKACDKPFYINKEWIEDEVINAIEQRFNPEEVRKTLKDLNAQLKENFKVYDIAIKSAERDLQEKQKQIDNLLDFVGTTGNKAPSSIKERIEKLDQEKEALLIQKKNVETSIPSYKPISEEQVNVLLKKLKSIIKTGAPSDKRRYLQTFVEGMEADPDKKVVNIRLYKDPTGSFSVPAIKKDGQKQPSSSLPSKESSGGRI